MKTLDMTQGKPMKLLLQFALPVFAGNLFQQLYMLIDRVIVGQFVGASAFSAIGATNAMSMMFMSMCMGTSIGTGVVVSQYFGAKDEKSTAAAIANGAYVNIIVAVIMTVIALLATKPLLVFKQTLQLGIPTGFQYSLMYISTIILQRVVNGFGESVIGAFTASSQMKLLVQQIYAALGTAMVTYTGQNIGAGKTERIKQGMQSAMVISAAVSGILAVVFWIGGNMIMGIFVSDTEIISLAAKGIRITSLFFMALGVVQVLRYLLNGAGDSVYALLNGIVEVVARISFAVILTAIPFIGMWGIWLTTSFTWFVTAAFAFFRYKGGAWKSKSLVNTTAEN